MCSWLRFRSAVERLVGSRLACDGMAEELPLAAQLSAAFVALAIEIDNAAELEMAHHTSSEVSDGGSGVWLASIAMWFSAVRVLTDADELTVAEVRQRTGLDTNVDGLRRWGYATVNGVGSALDGQSRPVPRESSVLRLTRRGRDAGAVWSPMPAAIEQRWRDRFGDATVDRLRAALVRATEPEGRLLPDYLPILGFGLWGERRGQTPGAPTPSPELAVAESELSMISLLARALLSLTLDFEAEARLALPVWADGLRLLSSEPTALRDLPQHAGVGKEALAMVLHQLERTGCAEMTKDSGSRGKQVRLTSLGERARSAGALRFAELGNGWAGRSSSDVDDLRAALQPLVGDGTRTGSRLFFGLDPAAGNWRATVREPLRLPWYPLVLHRGGYPDGS